MTELIEDATLWNTWKFKMPVMMNSEESAPSMDSHIRLGSNRQYETRRVPRRLSTSMYAEAGGKWCSILGV